MNQYGKSIIISLLRELRAFQVVQSTKYEMFQGALKLRVEGSLDFNIIEISPYYFSLYNSDFINKIEVGSNTVILTCP